MVVEDIGSTEVRVRCWYWIMWTEDHRLVFLVGVGEGGLGGQELRGVAPWRVGTYQTKGVERLD